MTNGFIADADCSLDAFLQSLEPGEAASVAPNAVDVIHQVPIYDAAELAPAMAARDARIALMAEWAHVLREGAGVLALKRAYRDTEVIDAASEVFEAIIADERVAGEAQADHFADGGADRIWNAHQKLGERAPEVFVDYVANTAIHTVCEAWLGPGYQMTTQVNVVRPGGAGQRPHRDYHLGFQTDADAATYPAHAHMLSPFLTLQGGVAHGDMPVETGPTQLLPFSQRFEAGYRAVRRPEFQAVFDERAVQLPLEKGDALFFNPALFHAAGSNRSADRRRMVNLLQVSSAFGRAMESVDRLKLSMSALGPLQTRRRSGALSDEAFEAAMASIADGYPFPTNLDRDPPAGGLAPPTQQALLRQAVEESWSATAAEAAFREQLEKRRA